MGNQKYLVYRVDRRDRRFLVKIDLDDAEARALIVRLKSQTPEEQYYLLPYNVGACFRVVNEYGILLG